MGNEKMLPKMKENRVTYLGVLMVGRGKICGVIFFRE
jgi:hypothetical protein